MNRESRRKLEDIYNTIDELANRVVRRSPGLENTNVSSLVRTLSLALAKFERRFTDTWKDW